MIGQVDTYPKRSIKSGQTTVSASGTAVQVASGENYEAILLKALEGNTGNVYVGNDGNEDVTSSNGIELTDTGESILLYTSDAIYVDAANNDDTVAWIILTAAEGAY